MMQLSLVLANLVALGGQAYSQFLVGKYTIQDDASDVLTVDPYAENGPLVFAPADENENSNQIWYIVTSSTPESVLFQSRDLGGYCGKFLKCSEGSGSCDVDQAQRFTLHQESGKEYSIADEEGNYVQAQNKSIRLVFGKQADEHKSTFTLLPVSQCKY